MPETLAVLKCAYNVEEEFQDTVVENDASQPDDSNAVEMSQSTLRKDEASSDFSKFSITSQHHGNIGMNKCSSSGIDHWRGPPDPRKPGKTVPNKGHYAKKMMTLQREVRDLRMMRQTIQFRRYLEQEIINARFHSIGDSSDETGETGRPG